MRNMAQICEKRSAETAELSKTMSAKQLETGSNARLAWVSGCCFGPFPNL